MKANSNNKNENPGKVCTDSQKRQPKYKYKDNVFLNKLKAYIAGDIALAVIRDELGYPTGANIASDAKKFIHATSDNEKMAIIDKIEKGSRGFDMPAFIWVMEEIGNMKFVGNIEGCEVFQPSASASIPTPHQSDGPQIYKPGTLLQSVITLGRNCGQEGFSDQASTIWSSISREFAEATIRLIEAVLCAYLMGVLMRLHKNRMNLHNGKSVLGAVTDLLPTNVGPVKFAKSEGSVKSGLRAMQELLTDELKLDKLPSPQDENWQKFWKSAETTLKDILANLQIHEVEGASYVLVVPENTAQILANFPGLTRFFPGLKKKSNSHCLRPGRLTVKCLADPGVADELVKRVQHVDVSDDKEIKKFIGRCPDSIETLTRCVYESDRKLGFTLFNKLRHMEEEYRKKAEPFAYLS